MQTVRGEDGRRYLLVKRSGDASRVRDPETGEERHLPNDELEPVAGESPLATAARAVPDGVRAVVSATRTDETLGLLVELAERGPLAAAQVLDRTDLCESDLHGAVAEFRAAGLVREATVHGERGYDATETAREAVAFLTRSDHD